MTPFAPLAPFAKVAILFLWLLPPVSVWAQSSAENLEILVPRKNEYISGRVTMEAAVAPGQRAVKRVLFFADGKLVCDLEAGPYQCSFDAGPDIDSHLIRVVAEFDEGPRIVRNLVTPKRAKGLSFRAEVRVVLVPTTVTRKGRFVTDLEAESFRVYEDGEPQEIVSFSAHDTPLEIVVAVDASASMKNGMPKLKQAVRSFLSLLAPHDRVTLLAFNDEIYTLAGEDSSPEARLESLSRLEPFGRTSLYDAVARSLQILDKRSGKRAVVVFTDGQDVSSQMSLEEIEALVESGNSTLFMIGTEKAIRKVKLRKVLERLSQRSGGRALLDKKLDRLEDAFADVYREIRSQYLLGYLPTNQNFDGGWRSIRLEVLSDRLEIRGREGYRAQRR